MEHEVSRPERRGRKRRVDVQDTLVDGQERRLVNETRSRALVGRYVRKEFEGSGVFLGKIVYYDSGLYRVDYEDGDCEDLEGGEVKEFLVGDSDFDRGLMIRKKKLDDLIAKKDVNVKKDMKATDLGVEGNVELITKKDVKAMDLGVEGNVELIPKKDVKAMDLGVEGNVELIAKKDVKAMDLGVEGNVAGSVNVEVSSVSGFGNDDADEIDVVRVNDDADSSSDSCEHAQDRDASLVVLPLPPQLPPSSGTIGVPEESVSHLFSVYCFLRSFSIQLFLSPFGLDDFVGSLNCYVQNTLLDAIHVALMRALRRHLENLSSNGSELASKCLRLNDWSLLDTLTWPVYLTQYLMVMGYTNGPEWKGFYVDIFEKDYYTLSVSLKLMILQILCNDVLESDKIRPEIDMREEAEVGIDSDAVANVACEPGPRRVHPRYAKTSACKNKEAMDIIAETHGTRSSCYSSSLGVHGNEMDVDADIAHDGNVDECRLCGMDGTLLCCDGCPSAFHSRCIGVTKTFIPGGDWYCPECAITKTEPTITRGTSLRGADVLGIDSYGQVFLGACNHLLVLKISIDSDPCLRYYNYNDIPNVLQALCSSVQHVFLYSEICKEILRYWGIPKEIVPLVDTFEMGERYIDGEFSTPSLPFLGKESCNVKDVVKSENLASCVTGHSAAHTGVSCLQNSFEEPGFNRSLLDTMPQTEHHGQQRSGDNATKAVSRLTNTEHSLKTIVDLSPSSCLVSQQIDPSGLSQQSITGRSSLTELGISTSGNGDRGYRGQVNGICVAVNTSPQIKEYRGCVGGIGSTKLSDHCLYTGSYFKSHVYVNNYVPGDFAASAAANLAILLSEENQGSESHVSDTRKKPVSANNSLQLKAFSSAAIRFFWPNPEKKLVEVPRERCGWCFSCRAPASSRRGCLLNAAASNAIKGAIKILAGLRLVSNVEGSLYGIAMYIMFLEESLCGLMGGPFRSAVYRQQWREQLEQATTCSAIKTLLLKLEENIRSVALSGDWAKHVDNGPIESSVDQCPISAAGLTRKRRQSGRRGRKSFTVSDLSYEDCLDSSSDFIWWRGGMQSKKILQRGVLPFTVTKKAARLGGCRKIPGVCYTDGSEIPKRSRQVIWRAAVEMSKNASQLALQVRYLDFYVRWGDLVRPEQNLQDGKGPETEASAFRNASVCDKKTMKDKVIYGVAFGNQKHLPSRVKKSIIETDQGEDGKDKHWFSETLVPLYLIKLYEEKEDKLLPPLAEKPVNVLSDLQRRQLKASRKDIFSYLSLKRDNLGKCSCASCQLDVLLRNSVKCSACGGFVHEQCTICSASGSGDEVGFLITCKQCYHLVTLPQHGKNNEPTSPLVLQGQKSRNRVTVSKGAKQKSFNQSASVGHVKSSLKTKPAVNGSNLVTKKRPKLCSWGLILKKNSEDSGTDFRLNNIILRGNSDETGLSPVCHLCQKPYNADLMYICCEMCTRWYHAAAVELEESEIFEVVGFRCCRCRRVRLPECPYSSKTGNSTVAEDHGISSGRCKELESNGSELPEHERILWGPEENSLLFSLSSDQQFREHNPEMDCEWNTTIMPAASGNGPQKLPIRRHTKPERNGDYPNMGELSTPIEPNGLLNHGYESLSPKLEWDVSEDVFFKDGELLDWEGLNYEDMEFEPQTYFSFTELLASDDGGQVGQGDASGDALTMNCQQESTISVGPTGDTLPCQICLEPLPELCCQICGTWVHIHCSQLVEQSSWEGDTWRCGQCQEWH